jgi:antitoxin HigA-1
MLTTDLQPEAADRSGREANTCGHCIEALDLTITEAAKILGVTRQTLNNLVTGKSGISANMAIRLDNAFGGGAETWLRLQMAYD